jgi:hypothetical protein
MGEGRGIYRVLVGKPKGNRPFGRCRHICENNIKLDFQEVGWGIWIGLSWLSRDRWWAIVNALKCGEFFD